MKVYIARPDFTDLERAAIRSDSEPGVTQFAQGPEVAAFEREFAGFVGQTEAIAVNSGSSANLLLFSALLEMRRLSRGDEVIVPACTFGRVVSPLYQLGLVPVYVDIDEESLNLDPHKIVAALSERTKAIFAVHTLGNPAPMKEIAEIAGHRNIMVIEDCCEAHGATVGEASVGSFSVASTYSFFVAHNMTTFEGGLVATSDLEISMLVRSLREFGRSFGDRWDYEDEHLEGYDRRYVFQRLGYSVKMLDLQAAVGRVQLRRLTEMNERRRLFAATYNRELFGDRDIVPGHVYYAYPMRHRDRDAIVRKLDEVGVETRPLFAGALHLQPAYRDLSHRVAPSPVAERIKDEGFFLPCHSAMTGDEVQYVVREVKKLIGFG